VGHFRLLRDADRLERRIRGQLARVFGEDRADALLILYQVLEAQLEADGS